jgi:hypothetical protein
MKRSARIALVSVGLAWAGLALAEPTCTYREEEGTSPAATKDSVTLLGVEPPEGAELRKDLVVAADVQFQIADFQPDTYIIVAMFPTVGFGSMSPGDPGNTPMLQHASGKVHLCVPLQEIYDHPGMLWPLSMSAAMLKMTDARSSSLSASTRQVKFKSQDAPANPKVLPDEYYDALQHTNSFFDNHMVLYKLCIARFPATQPAFTKAYRAWEARHRADIDLVAELQFERYKEMTRGREDHAASIADATSAANRQFYDGLKPASLKHECDMRLSEFADPDDTTDIVIGDEMAILRKHSGKEMGK